MIRVPETLTVNPKPLNPKPTFRAAEGLCKGGRQGRLGLLGFERKRLRLQS